MYSAASPSKEGIDAARKEKLMHSISTNILYQTQ